MKYEMLTIIEAHPLQDFKLALTFNNGKSGTVDLAGISRTGVFEAWNDPAYFRKVFVHPEFHTVTWPGNLDLDPYVLYAQMTGKCIEDVLASV
jgi:hypothetical protein